MATEAQIEAGVEAVRANRQGSSRQIAEAVLDAAVFKSELREAAREITDRLTCAQCGERFEDRACGIAHAIIQVDPLEHRLIQALLTAARS